MNTNLPSSDSVTIAPLFGDALVGPPHIFDFSSGNPRVLQYDPSNFKRFQMAILRELLEHGLAWGIGRYREERRALLRSYPQILSEGRVYHAGIDITSPAGTPLYAPIDATVLQVGKEEGIGNYGGFVILRHHAGPAPTYSFYGHLRSRHLVTEGRRVGAGERFAVLGDGEDSGGWFTHTHVQILTQRAVDEGRTFQGYVTADALPTLDELFPSPEPLLRLSRFALT